jgi:predicted DNA-binding transcriptional regulator AlpA
MSKRKITAPSLLTTSASTILTVAEVASFLKIPASSVYEKTRFRSGQKSVPVLPHRRVGKYLRFILSEVEAWLLALPQSTKTKKRGYRKSVMA